MCRIGMAAMSRPVCHIVHAMRYLLQTLAIRGAGHEMVHTECGILCRHRNPGKGNTAFEPGMNAVISTPGCSVFLPRINPAFAFPLLS